MTVCWEKGTAMGSSMFSLLRTPGHLLRSPLRPCIKSHFFLNLLNGQALSSCALGPEVSRTQRTLHG